MYMYVDLYRAHATCAVSFKTRAAASYVYLLTFAYTLCA